MSNEQTPMTAEEFLKDRNFSFSGCATFKKTDLIKRMEQYAQAKVLEALEREKSEVLGYINSLSEVAKSWTIEKYKNPSELLRDLSHRINEDHFNTTKQK